MSVEPGGCSGFSYKFELEQGDGQLEPEDTVFEQHGARVVVDDGSLALVAGSTIDFEEEVGASAIHVRASPLVRWH